MYNFLKEYDQAAACSTLLLYGYRGWRNCTINLANSCESLLFERLDNLSTSRLTAPHAYALRSCGKGLEKTLESEPAALPVTF
jgi:hypothetical protein